MDPKVKRNTVIIKSKKIALSFIKGTPVLPALSKKSVDDIIDLLEELDIESEYYEEDSPERE